MGINFDSSQNYQDGSNISISKKMHVHTIDRKDTNTSVDQIVASDSDYQEEYVPPASNPQLGLANPNASNKSPKSTPSPQNAFLGKMQNMISNLTPSQLNSLGQGTTLQEAQSKLIFAFEHPGVTVDPNVQNLLNQLENQATANVEKRFNLPNWQPSSTDNLNADKLLTDQLNSNFENLANSTLPPNQAKRIIFEYYHPEFASQADQRLLNNLKSQANSETAEDAGYPDNWSPSADSSNYDARVDSFYDQSFAHHALTQGLTDQELAELETLHQFPDADVPDKAKLQPLMQQLNEKALQDTAQKFNLPDGFKPEPCFKDFASVVLGTYNSQFADNVENMKPPLSAAQKKLLLGTGGIKGKNLPPHLAALFTTLQTKTADDVAEMLGLPKNWLQKTKAGEEISIQGETEDVGEENEAGSSKSTSKDENVGLDGLSNVLRKKLRSKALGSQEVKKAGKVTSRVNHQAALNAIQFYQDGTRLFSSLVSNLTGGYQAATPDPSTTSSDPSQNSGVAFMTQLQKTLGNDWMMAGQFTFAVTKALDKLRNEVYKVEYAEAEMSKQTTAGSIDNQNTQNILNQIAAQKTEQANKPAKNPFQAFENIPGPIGVLAKAMEFELKSIFWVMDIVTGGAVSAICQACGIQDLSENPLEMLGVLTPQQAQTMDFAMQIIAMVVEIAVEVMCAQPELVMGEVAMMAEEVGELGAQVAIKTAVKEAVEAGAKEGVEVVAESVAKSVTKDALKAIAENVAEQMGQGLSKTELKQVTKAVEKALTENAEKIVKTATKQAEKLMKEGAEEAVEKATQELENVTEDVASAAAKAEDRTAGDVAKYVLKKTAQDIKNKFVEAANKVRSSIAKGAKGMSKLSHVLKDTAGEARFTKLADFISTGAESEEEVVQGIAKSAREARMSTTGLAKMNKAYQAASFARDVVQGSLTVANDVISGINSLNQAQLAKLMGELDAALTDLNAELKILKQVESAILDSLSSLSGWVNDINKQEGDFYKKMQIHFVAA